MKHLTVADESLLAAIGPDGAEAIVTFLLNPGLTSVAETTHSSAPPQDHTGAEQYLHDRVTRHRGAGAGSGEDVAGTSVWNEIATE